MEEALENATNLAAEGVRCCTAVFFWVPLNLSGKGDKAAGTIHDEYYLIGTFGLLLT